MKSLENTRLPGRIRSDNERKRGKRYFGFPKSTKVRERHFLDHVFDYPESQAQRKGPSATLHTTRIAACQTACPVTTIPPGRLARDSARPIRHSRFAIRHSRPLGWLSRIVCGPSGRAPYPGLVIPIGSSALSSSFSPITLCSRATWRTVLPPAYASFAMAAALS